MMRSSDGTPSGESSSRGSASGSGSDQRLPDGGASSGEDENLSRWQQFAGNQKSQIAAVYAILSIAVLAFSAVLPFAGPISLFLSVFGIVVAYLARRETRGFDNAGRLLSTVAGLVCVIVMLINTFAVFATTYSLV